MGKAQRLSEGNLKLNQQSPEQEAPTRRSGLDVPTDWFVDPADPAAADRLEHGLSLEDQATAFLAAHEAAEKNAEAGAEAPVQGAAEVTALTEAPSRRTESQPTPGQEQDNVWLGIPTLIPAEQVEGELAWQVDALCAQTDPEAFFPEKGGSTRDAKKVCAACNVKQECLDYALANDEKFGIWGGLSERERRKLRKRAL
ncbi:WhiB family transcriptional regulator [Nesterenkonia flava]|uniref:Transcriptional regulator WhiB n=1 Tax=Nesterenkonia flava TaxID=469799 RepID=A0ABU1FQ52_9MICC|nr:WhiB family transcriptional regulator [Nesterenkonia flava]MDR5710788.1 WhiB family transcriptional regulator [Nesterenkonia flava]